jgi:hypothetical protein
MRGLQKCRLFFLSARLGCSVQSGACYDVREVMTMNTAGRGCAPSDPKDFSPESMELLHRAQRHLCYLINEGYDAEKSIEFIGNHFLLSSRQRLALFRSAASEASLLQRGRTCRQAADLHNAAVAIDGFNQIITAEILLSGGLLLSCMDGTIRDLAGLHGTYRIIEPTMPAIRLILSRLQQLQISSALFVLDRPVSNSGRLKQAILEAGREFSFPIRAEVMDQVDSFLIQQPLVITSDSAILDACSGWYNLMPDLAAADDHPPLQFDAEVGPDCARMEGN